MKLEKNRILILQFDLGNPRHNQKLFSQDTNLSSVALTNEIRRDDGGKFS